MTTPTTQGVVLQTPPQAQPERSELGHMSFFDVATLILALVGACILGQVRSRRQIPHSLDIWFGDALSIGSLAVLGAVIAETVLPHADWFENVVKANGFLIVISLIYAALVIINSLRKSVRASCEETAPAMASAPVESHQVSAGTGGSNARDQGEGGVRASR